MSQAKLTSLLKWRHLLRRYTQKFFDEKGFIEVEAPVLVPLPGAEVHLDYFSTNYFDFSEQEQQTFLRSSPEIHLKQAVAAGAERVYCLAPCFRNGGELGKWHMPEFSMLEWYAAESTLAEMQSFTLDYLQQSCRYALSLGLNPAIDIEKPCLQMTVKEAFKSIAKIHLQDGDPNLATLAKGAGINSIQGGEDFETAYFKVFLEKIEPAIAKAGICVLTDYPASQSVLAEVVDGWSKRFEVYVNGVELCNAFQELRSQSDNLTRLKTIEAKRISLGKRDQPAIDEDFALAMAEGLPLCSGNALGFDRWLAVLLGASDIRHVIPFANRRPFESSVAKP